MRPDPAVEDGIFREFTSLLRLVFWMDLFQPLLLNGLHEFVELRDLLVYIT